MAYFMFIDESGQDQQDSPYEVLAGVVVKDTRLWPLIRQLHRAELDYFGCRYGTPHRELKAKRLLKTKVFRHASSADKLNARTRRSLAKACLENGSQAGPDERAALGQAKLAYVESVLRLARGFECRAFAIIAGKDAPRPADDYLRKDYAFLFERFFFLLEKQPEGQLGIVVFDELERSKSHLLIDQMEKYFMGNAIGRSRRSRIIPEPFFVHSELTTGIHLADLVAYVVSWGVRIPDMTADAREDLREVAKAVSALKYDMTVPTKTGIRTVWAFSHVKDLRPSKQQAPAAAAKSSP
jgi:hypothetical protein